MTDAATSALSADELDLLADPKSLARRTGLDEQDPLLLERLVAASDRFREAVGFHVSQLVDDELLVDGTGDSLLHLGTAPVTAVSAVLVDGVVLAPSRYHLVRRLGTLELKGGGVWSPRADIEVICTHGYPSSKIPRGISEAVLEQAEMGVNARIGVQSQTVLGDSVTFGASNIGVTAKWTEAVQNYAQGRDRS